MIPVVHNNIKRNVETFIAGVILLGSAEETP